VFFKGIDGKMSINNIDGKQVLKATNITVDVAEAQSGSGAIRGAFPADTRAFFHADTPPIGWTKVAGNVGSLGGFMNGMTQGVPIWIENGAFTGGESQYGVRGVAGDDDVINHQHPFNAHRHDATHSHTVDLRHSHDAEDSAVQGSLGVGADTFPALGNVYSTYFQSNPLNDPAWESIITGVGFPPNNNGNQSDDADYEDFSIGNPNFTTGSAASFSSDTISSIKYFKVILAVRQ
jgi:hypothetical protein